MLVTLALQYSNREFEDRGRVVDEIWRGDMPQQQRLRWALLCINPDNLPVAQVNVLELQGSSTLSVVHLKFQRGLTGLLRLAV
jgi:hypothetical protein